MSGIYFDVTIDTEALSHVVTSQVIHDRLQVIADDVVSEAQGLAPVLTGALRDSIHAVVEGRDSFEVVADVDYASYVEFGTSHMAAQPFLRPAIDAAARSL